METKTYTQAHVKQAPAATPQVMTICPEYRSTHLPEINFASITFSRI